MAEQLTIYTPSDRFATMAKNGESRIWQIDQDGIPELAAGRPAPQPVEWRAPESMIFGKPISKITHEEARKWLPRFEGRDDPEGAYCAAVLNYIASKPELPEPRWVEIH